MPTFDNKGTLVINKKYKLAKEKLLYFHNVIEKNPTSRLDVLNDQDLESRLKLVEAESLTN